MEIIHVVAGERPRRLETATHLPDSGFLWLDFDRVSEPDWAGGVERLVGAPIHEGHIKDSLNPDHPSYTDATSHYEMVILRGLAPDPDTDSGRFASRPTAFFLFERVLVTVRPADSRSVALTRDRLLNRHGRIPRRPVGLMHMVISAMIDRFLELRDPLIGQLDDWRRNLLDPNHPFDDWLQLMGYRNQLRALELLCEGQEDALTQWRDNTDLDIDDHLAVRLNDVVEHVRRVARFATDQQREVEALVQLHFSAVAHRTNEIVRVLTVISAIFLPLTLVAGIFGMNFEYMPELHYRYAYFFALGGMTTLGLGLLYLFRRKRWF